MRTFSLFMICVLFARSHCNVDEDAAIQSDFCNDKPLYNPHPSNCGKYIVCSGPIGAYILSCPDELHWDRINNVCNWKKFADCGDHNTITKPFLKTPTTTTKTTTAAAATTASSITNPAITSTSGKYKQAKTCDRALCKLPRCACADTSQPPKSLSASKIPQMILLTWEGGNTKADYDIFKELLDGKKNPNGCNIKATFFVNDVNNDYSLTKNLYDKGHEIAASTQHLTEPEDYWKTIGYDTYVTEIVGMKEKLIKNGIKNVVGFRSPFLKTAGDVMFEVLKDNGFLYDSSLATGFVKAWWPFTLDYRLDLSPCKGDSCPINAYPGLWEIPKQPFRDALVECVVYTTCHRFKSIDKAGALDFLNSNFDRQYKGLRAPFSLFGKTSWMFGFFYQYRKEALLAFIDSMKDKDDVYFVTMSQAIEWMKNPTTLDKIKGFKPWSC